MARMPAQAAWLALVLVGCGGARTPVREAPPPPVTDTAATADAEVAAPAPEPPPAPPRPRPTLTASAPEAAAFEVRPDDQGPRFACDDAGCLAVWVEGRTILSLRWTPGSPLPHTPTRTLRLPGRDPVEVRALARHPDGFAMLVTTGDPFASVALELVLLDASGALRHRPARSWVAWSRC